MEIRSEFTPRKGYLLAVGLLLLSLPALCALEPASGPDTCIWRDHPVFDISALSFPVGEARQAVFDDVERWNDVRGKWLTLTAQLNDATMTQSGDGSNTVGFVAGSAIDYFSGLTCLRVRGNRIIEADVLMNADLAWGYGFEDERVRSGGVYFRQTLLHELGHAIGLRHQCTPGEPGELAVMSCSHPGNAIWYGGVARFRHHPAPADCEGARFLYPAREQERDFAAMNFKVTGPCFAEIPRAASTVTSVLPGGTIEVQYTICNPGNVRSTMLAAIYLSADEDVDRFDQYIAGFRYTLGGNTALEQTKTIALPKTVPPGVYHLGLVIDPTDLASEHREGNNTLVFPGTWRIVPGTDNRPDLLPLRISDGPLGFCNRDDNGQLVIRVRNQGKGPAPPSTTRVTFSPGKSFSSTTPAIPVGAATEVRFSIPADCFDFDCDFTIEVDANSNVNEIEEENNRALGLCLG